MVESVISNPFDDAFQGKYESIKALVDLTPSAIHAKDADERTLLHWASSGGRIDVVQLLLDRGARVDATDDSQWTPAMIAASANKFDVAEALLKAGASATLQNDQGLTCLHYAASKNLVSVRSKI